MMDSTLSSLLSTLPSNIPQNVLDAFFSKGNIEVIQQLIHDKILAEGYMIDPQDSKSLIFLMKNIIGKAAGDILSIERLNEDTATSASRIILGNIRIKLLALSRIDKSPAPLDRGINTNIRGTRLS